MKKVLLALPLIVFAVAAQASETDHAGHSQYAGQENQAIKSLSPDDIAELRRGGGWGLARAAELNGVPGPVHLLELKADIGLNATQVSALENLYEQMKARAVDQGEKLIAQEQELEKLFSGRTVTDATLRASLKAIATARMELRYVHLATHLKTPDILSQDQIGKYNTLRGYANPDPCDLIPKGHDPDKWHKHNGCK